MFFAFSLLALWVMSVDRYLATHYPLVYRTSVTKGKLLFTFLAIIHTAVIAISINDLVIPYQFGLLIFGILVILPMLFINCKLFTVPRKSRRNNGISPEMKKSFSLKTLSSWLLVVACLMTLFMPALIYIGLRLTCKETKFTLGNTQLEGLWARTAASMNSTFNCLIFYLKNKAPRG